MAQVRILGVLIGSCSDQIDIVDGTIQFNDFDPIKARVGLFPAKTSEWDADYLLFHPTKGTLKLMRSAGGQRCKYVGKWKIQFSLVVN